MPRKRRKSEGQIRIFCEHVVPGELDGSAAYHVDILELTAVDRQNLSRDLTFKDLRNRVRLAGHGEPLLSNMGGPAVLYPDGTADFFINGESVKPEQVPFMDEHKHVAAEVKGRFWYLNEDGDAEKRMKVSSAEAIMECCDDTHCWTNIIEFEGGSRVMVDITDDCVDVDSWLIEDCAAADMEPGEIFHTEAFGQALLEWFTLNGGTMLGDSGYAGPLNEFGRDSVMRQLKNQLKIEAVEPKKETPAQAEVTSHGPGIGTMIAAGLATVAIGALGSAAMKDHAASKMKSEVQV